MRLKESLTLAKKDISMGIYSPVLVSLAATYVFVTGFFFFTYMKVFSPFQKMVSMSDQVSGNLNTAVIEPTLQANLVLLLFIIPILSMRMFSEERDLGTYEYLMSLPISEESLVFGKWLSSSIFIWITITLGLTFPFALCAISDPEVYPVLISSMSLYVISGTLIALGVLFSAISTSAVLSAIACLVFFLIWFVIDAPFSNFGGSLSSFFREISLSVHSSLLLKGLFSTKSLYFFICVTILALYFSVEKIKSTRSA